MHLMLLLFSSPPMTSCFITPVQGVDSLNGFSCFCWFWQLSLCRFGAGYQIVQPMCSMKAIMIMKIQNWTTNHHRFITFSSRSCRIPFVFFLLFLLLC
ncbi:hypothetical protein HanRHA438_Chr17g0838411 [Helianthus annuus]|nr:hypothetical protein HanHA300_Chr17g0674261 [Helianthus annuus]KAJ0449346.1 hypothetical protein HanHA89_Chr17g0727451 [Helianthus annuus]KAJ0634192.1 hypothetical protein HanLR1_Chr17g0685401 [Helianthus annuus]KAJ0637996.1 hypothetical protein HanOQP8_Chr17g0680331 [Helianthus annuus]KAJ0828542.1 hypothetical protein HanRHA438_Chr17g0838411 [Helianthus annuus]